MRIIDADALVEAIKDYPYGFRGMVAHDIAKLPTIDAVPVVRCKDCKRHNAKAGKLYRCDLLNVWYDGDFFCANGERSEE